MSAPAEHRCRPLSVAGVLRCVARDHWWQPAVIGTAVEQRRPDLKLVAS